MTPTAFSTVPIAPLPLERFAEVLDETEMAELVALAQRAQTLMQGRAVWCVNSTANGGRWQAAVGHRRSVPRAGLSRGRHGPPSHP